ncbi:hypothetical protein [Acinetobacter sp. CFCC 10889]|uniref:hypothetical protein n=1 Tax=Acinetobacter sp. CFCC 10889 TaxID=1775557 RepID=UPI001D190C81|nr:hypothetical protein [Acinetobacter sp. CFCC 10889]
MKSLSIAILSIMTSFAYANSTTLDAVSEVSNSANTHLVQMTDEELSATQGQALYNLTRTNDSNQGLSFYRLGMEANIDINANIKKLQLGCGGSKGSGCDIDIDNVALTGITEVIGGSAGVPTDFKLTNPFIEFAITDADKASTRSISGFRLGALKALGMMSFGENDRTDTLDDDKGINSISADIGVGVSNAKIRGVKIVGDILGTQLATIDATIDPYNKRLVFDRSPTLSLIGLTAVTDSIYLLGVLDLPLGLKLNANLNNIPFATIHRLKVANADGSATSGAYLSLQSKDITWMNVETGQLNSVAAKKGWWMSIPQVSFDNLNVDGSQVRIKVSEAAGGILGSTIQFPAIDLGQRPVHNCYGSLKFC